MSNDTCKMNQWINHDSVGRMLAKSDTPGGMVALVPTAEDASRLAIPGWESSSILHTTLLFLGDDFPDDRRAALIQGVGEIANEMGPIEANIWAAASFNPHGENPCAAYLVGGAAIAAARKQITYLEASPHIPEQHQPWIPHVTIGYGLSAAALNQFGPISFDRLRVAFNNEGTDFFLK